MGAMRVEVGEYADAKDIISRRYYKLLKGRSFSFKTGGRASLGDTKGGETGSMDRWWEQTQTGTFRKMFKRKRSDSHILFRKWLEVVYQAYMTRSVGELGTG